MEHAKRREPEDQQGREREDVVHRHHHACVDFCEDGEDRAHGTESTPLELEQVLTVRGGAFSEDGDLPEASTFILDQSLAFLDLLNYSVSGSRVGTSVNEKALKAFAAGSKEESVGVGGSWGEAWVHRRLDQAHRLNPTEVVADDGGDGTWTPGGNLARRVTIFLLIFWPEPLLVKIHISW